MNTVTSSSSRKVFGLLLLMTATSALIAADRYWDVATVGGWATAANWDENTLPVNGDSLFFGPALPGVAVNAGTMLINTSLNVNTLTISNVAALTFQIQAATTLTLNNINYNTTGNHLISSAGGGVVALGSNAIWDINGGGIFTGLAVNSILSGTSSITKTGVRALTLSGSNTFSGGINLKNGTIFAQTTQHSNSFGTGAVTFANDAVGVNNATNTISINNFFTANYANSFINDNASTTNVASISIGGSAANTTQTFSGSFSTGASYNAAQFLNLNVANGSTGVQNGTLIFSGDWSAYNAGTAFDGIRLLGAGNVVLNAAQSVAPTNYRINNNSSTDGAKLILGAAFTMNRAVTFFGNANGMRNGFGTRAGAATTTILAGDGANALVLTDTDGANVFAQNASSTLAVTGLVSGAGSLRVNDGYTFVSGSTGQTPGTNTLQTPTGTVNLSSANTNTGGVIVSSGTLLVTNITGSGTGTGAVRVGTVGTVNSGNSSFGAVASRVLTGIDTARASGWVIGQEVSGTGVTPGTRITGITIGAATATISISAPLTAANPSLTSLAFSTNATLAGTGTLAGATTINSGSFLNPGLGGETRGVLVFGNNLTLAGTTTFDFSGGSDRGIDFDGINVSGLRTNGGTMLFNFSSTISSGSYSLFSLGTATGDFTRIDFAGDGYTVDTFFSRLANSWTGTALDGTIFVFNQSSGNLVVTVIPEPSTYPAMAGVLAAGVVAFRRRRKA